MTNDLEYTNPTLGENTNPETTYTLEYALMQIEKIASDKDAILGAFNALSCMESGACPTGGSADAMAKAVSDTVLARETTNQKLIEFYGKMVDDLKPRSENTASTEQKDFLSWITSCLAATKPGVMGAPDYAKIWNSIHGQDQSDKWNAIAKLADAALITGDSDEVAEARTDMIAEIRQILRENQ